MTCSTLRRLMAVRAAQRFARPGLGVSAGPEDGQSGPHEKNKSASYPSPRPHLGGLFRSEQHCNTKLRRLAGEPNHLPPFTDLHRPIQFSWLRRPPLSAALAHIQIISSKYRLISSSVVGLKVNLT